jgi:hypothetical protein
MRKQLATILRFLADRIDPPFAFEPALATTQFDGSGLTINQYGVDLSNPASVEGAASWAIRRNL